MNIIKTENYSYYVRDGVEVRCYPVKVALNLNDCGITIDGENSAVIAFVTNENVLPHLYDKLTLDYYKNELNFQAFAGFQRGYLDIKSYNTEYTIHEKDILYKNGFNIFNSNPPDNQMIMWGTKIFQNLCHGIQSIQEYFVLRYIQALPKGQKWERLDSNMRERLNELISIGVIKEDIGFEDNPMYIRYSFRFRYNVLRFDLTYEK